MTIADSFVKLFTSTDVNRYSDEQIRHMLRSRVLPHVKEYQKHFSKQAKVFGKRKPLFRLHALRIFGAEIWESIVQGEHSKAELLQFRVSAIAKTYFRSMQATDENICLLEKGYGISMVSNVRMILECLAIAKYIWEAGEPEADRFQDFARVQAHQLMGDVDRNLFGDKYESGFYENYGWISDTRMKNMSSLIRRLNNEEYSKLYKFASQYVHASPYSIESVLKMNHESVTTKGSYFPLGEDETVALNEDLICDFMRTMIEYFMEPESGSFHKAIVDGIRSRI